MKSKYDKNRLFEVMSRVDKTFKPILNENMDIDEAGFSRLKQSMHGLVDNINSLGVITAENPNAEQLSPQDNKERNNQLKAKLKSMGLGWSQPDYGMFVNKESPVIIQNISKEELINLSQEFGQESCIWGSKQSDEEGVYFKWEYIERGITLDSETVYHNMAGQDVQNRTDFYTIIKGRKFIIPFYDDDKFKTPSPEFKIPTDKTKQMQADKSRSKEI